MPYIKYTWEFIEVFAKETHKKGGRREDIDITADEFKEWVLGRWSFLRRRYEGLPSSGDVSRGVAAAADEAVFV